MSMILFPIRLTAATARRTAVAPELSPKPLQPCEVRNLVLKPLFIALLTIREAERLRYLCFNFKTNDRGELIYKRVSCDLGNAIRDLKKNYKSVHRHRGEERGGTGGQVPLLRSVRQLQI